MLAKNPTDSALWAATLARAQQELPALPVAERQWLAARIADIGSLQGELDRLFRDINGPAVCIACRGGCCSRARHHTTLTNLLGFLLGNEDLPEPDFTLDCPYLGSQGCRLPVARRPFNCVIFLCEALDARLSEAQRAAFSSAERRLRAAYEAVAGRCPGASLRGLLIAAVRLGERPLLSRSSHK